MEELIHSWEEVRGNVFRKKIKPEMLLPEGEIVTKAFMLKGDSIYSEKSTVSIRYDLSYIEAKIKNDFLDPLSQKSLIDLQSLIDRAKSLDEAKECT